MMIRQAVTAVLVLLSGWLAPAYAAWPERPVTVIVPYGAGGTTDVLARLVTERLRVRFGVPFLVDNRTGAGGNIGSQVAAKAPADGYTLIVGTISTHSLNTLLNKDAGFDPILDFTAVSGLFDVPNILLVRAGLGASDVKQLIEMARQSPSKIFFGTTGAGSSQFMAAQLFQSRTGTKLRHVTYKGSGDIMTALLGGHLDLAFNTSVASMPLLTSESIKVMGVSSSKRLPGLETVPTLAETIPGFEMGAWAGLFAPANTSPEIVKALSDAVQLILQEPEIRAAAERLGSVTLPLPALEFKGFVAAEHQKWVEVIAKTGDQR